MRRHHINSIIALRDAGISLDDAFKLIRISSTLQRWYEMECSDGSNSWTIVRGSIGHAPGCPATFAFESADFGRCNCDRSHFAHDDDGRPWLEHRRHGRGKNYVTRTPLRDRERGALKRLKKIMARYPRFQAYVQTDPRGCALYILRPADIRGDDISTHYTNGIAVIR